MMSIFNFVLGYTDGVDDIMLAYSPTAATESGRRDASRAKTCLYPTPDVLTFPATMLACFSETITTDASAKCFSNYTTLAHA
jgi:hypothetical protein